MQPEQPDTGTPEIPYVDPEKGFTVSPPPGTHTSPNKGPVMGSGDVNLDGKINIHDAQLLSLYVNGYKELNDEQMTNGDVDGNGTVDEEDIQKLIKMAVGSI